MEAENANKGKAGTNSKRTMLPWIIVAVLAAVAVGYIIFLVFVLNGKDKPSDNESTDDPTKITVWRLKEEKVEVHPEFAGSGTITDCNNRILSETVREVCTYDEAGNPVRAIEYDESGKEKMRIEYECRCDSEGRWLQLSTEVIKDGQVANAGRNEFSYDDRGNRIRTKIYILPVGRDEYLFSDVKYEYNDDDLLVKDSMYTYVYNERGQQIQAWSGENLAYEFTYDDKGELRKAVYYATEQVTEKIGVGAVISEQLYKNGRRLEDAKDSYGHPVREFDEDGNVIKYTEYRLLANWEGDQSYVCAVSEYHYENGLLTEKTTTHYNRKGDETGNSRVAYVCDRNGTVLKMEAYSTKNVLTHRIERDQAGNVLLEEKYTDEGELIFRVERSYVSYRVSIWALTNEEARNLGGIFRKYIY